MNIDELKNHSGGEAVPFVIEKIIELPSEEYAEVCDDLLTDREFLKEVDDLAYVDSDGLWHCILVKAINGRDSLATNMEGYGYFRYTHYFPDCLELLGVEVDTKE